MLWLQFLFLFLLQKCAAFDLTDEEHDRLPTIFSLENYDKCVRYNGTYCLLRLDYFAEEGNELMDLIRNYSQNHHVKHFDYTYSERGVCISTTCREFIGDLDLDDPEQRHQVVQACSNHSVWSEYGLYANVTMELCEKKSEGIQIEKADWIVLGLFLAILALNLIATAYDLLVDDKERKKNGKGKKMLLCFSVVGNCKHLLSPGRNDPKTSLLKGINGLRNAGSIPVIFGHAAVVLFGGFIDNPHDIEKSFKTLHYQITINGTFVVQFFFVIASFLLVYNLEMSSETHKITWWSVPKILLFRFWRLTPPLALFLAFSATWMRVMGSGPLWSRNVLSLVNDCRKYWWTHILYINNYVSENRYCAIHTWHLAADTQLFLLALVVYVLTRNRGRNLALGVLLILGIVLPPLSVYLYNLDLTFFLAPEMSRKLGDDNLRYNFRSGHCNIAGYVIGMFTGYKMYEWQKKGTLFKNKKLGIAMHVLCAAFLFCLPHIIAMLNTDDVSLTTRMVYQATYRVAVCSAIALSIMSLSAYSNGALQWDLWVFLGKISYSVFLVHMNILHVLVGIRTQLDHLHFMTFVMIEFGFYVLSCVIAIPFYLLIEAPLTPLLKILLSPSDNQKKLDKVMDYQEREIEDIRNELDAMSDRNNREEGEIENIVNGKLKSL